MPPCSQDAGLSGFLASWQLVWCDSNVYRAGGATFVLWDQGRPVTQSLAGMAGTKPLCSWLSMPSQMCPECQHRCHPSCCLPSFSQASWPDCNPEAGKAAVVSGVFSKGIPQAGMLFSCVCMLSGFGDNVLSSLCLLSQQAALPSLGYSRSRYPLYARQRRVVAFHVQLPESGNPQGQLEVPSPLAEGGKKCCGDGKKWTNEGKHLWPLLLHHVKFFLFCVTIAHVILFPERN